MKKDTDHERVCTAFTRYLKDSGLACTAQRQALIAHILSGPAHFDIEEMVACVRRKKAGISRATIYRTIGHLERAGMVRKMDFDESHAHYEIVLDGSHHEHLVCEICGKIVEFEDDTLEKRIAVMAIEHGMEMTRHRVQIFGVCEECRKKTPSTNRTREK